MQRVLLTFVLVKLLVFAPLFNAPKKHVLNYFALEMAAIIVAKRRHRREQRACGRRERIFFPHVLIYVECQKNTLSEHIICQAMLFLILLQEIKNDLEPSSGSHAIPGLSKNFWPPVLFNVPWLLFFFILYLGLR